MPEYTVEDLVRISADEGGASELPQVSGWYNNLESQYSFEVSERVSRKLDFLIYRTLRDSRN